MKKITFLLSLVFAFLWGGITASAQVDFQPSEAPSSGKWAPNTTWYKMSLRAKYVTAFSADVSGNLYAKQSAEVFGEGALWCVVGDDENGYKLYNMFAGPNKPMTLTNMANDGAGRAQLVEGEGTLLDIKTTVDKNNKRVEGFFIKPFGTKDQWVNERGGYFSNWTSSAALGDGGSAIRFYAVADVDADVAKGIAELKSTLNSNIAKAEGLKGEGLGYYVQSKIDAAKSVAENTEAKTADVLNAINALTPNQPQAGVLYRIVSAYTAFENTQKVKKGVYTDGAGLYWADVDTKNPTQYWMFEPANGGCFYLKNAITHNYVYTANSMSEGKDRMVEISWPVNADGVPVANLRTGTDAPFHALSHGSGAGKGSSLTGYGNFGTETGGPSAWYIIPASLDDVHSITGETVAGLFPATEEKQVGLYKKDEVEALALACNDFASVGDLKVAVTIFEGLSLPKALAFSADKYYRFVNIGTSATYGYDVTLGVKDGKAFCSKGNKENIDFVWQVIPTTGGKHFIKNANGKTYLQPVQNGANAQTALGEGENAYELRKASVGVFKLWCYGGNGGNYPAQVETNKDNTFYLNGWDAGNATWKVFEIESVEIPLHAAGTKSYATTYLPFSVSAAEGAELYTGELNGNDMNLTKSHTGVAAEQGIVLVGESSATKAVLTIGEGTATSKGLEGTLAPKAVEASAVLTLGKSGSEVGFFAFTGTQIGANKAYITKPAGASAVMINFGEVTGIENAVAPEAANAPLYDLSGRRVVKAVKGGLYIQNGKKFIAR
jgi:hypothetical protein